MDPRQQNKKWRGYGEAGPSHYGRNPNDHFVPRPDYRNPNYSGQFRVNNQPKRWYPRDEKDAQQFRANHQIQRSNSVSSDSSSFRLNEPGKTKPYVCPTCKLPYNYFLSNNTIAGRVPRILPCKHTLCEECIRRGIKISNQIQCAVCLKNDFNRNHFCEYNHYVLGQLTCFRFSKSSLDSTNIALVPSDSKGRSSLTIDRFNSEQQNEKCGFKNCTNPGAVSCVDCCGIYCKHCDNALHNSGKQLMSHKRVSLNKTVFELNKCSDHNMFEEIFCKDCNQACCCYCVLEKHEGHSRMYLARLGPEEEDELVKAYEKAKLKRKHLLISQTKIFENEETNMESELEIEIAQKFADIHAQLYFIEKKLHEEAKKEINGPSNLEELSNTVGLNMKKLNYMINCVEEKDKIKFNLRLLLDNLKEIENLPAILVAVEGSGTPKLLIDEQINDLEKLFKIEKPEQLTFELKNVEEPPKEYQEDIEIPNINSVRNKSSSDSEFNKSNKSKLNQPRKDDKYKQRAVFVVHINSLSSFYVQFKEEEQMYHELEKEINNHVNKSQIGVHIVELKELYLAQRMCDKKRWCRVRVLEEIDDNYRYKVKFIDFGNTAVVSKTEMMFLSLSLTRKRPFAYECRLYNPSLFEWPEKTHLKLAQLLDINKELLMLTKEISNNVYTVELHINTSDGGSCSVTDILIFGHNVLQDKESSTTDKQQLNTVYENSDIYTLGKTYEVYIRYILDPWHIYVQRASYETTFRNLVKHMEGFYNNSRCDIHLPVKNSYIVIRFPTRDYGNWHRAKILNVFEKEKMVSVYLLDFGRCLRVSWKDTRKMSHLFRKFECLVVIVKLADVSPINAETWSDSDELGVVKFLNSYSKKDIIMKILVSSENPLEVVFFDPQENYDVNINALLVEKNLAVSSGKLTDTKMWIHKEKEKKQENNLLFIKDDTDEEEIEGEISGVRSEVEIVRFDDPNSFYVSFVSQMQKAEKLDEELQIHFKTQKNFQTDRDWEINDKVVAFDVSDKMYYRGIITSKENDKYCVDLLDKPDYLWVDYAKLRSIPTYFATTFPNMVFKCHLANIKPAGDSTKWSKMSLEWFEMLFKKHEEFYIKKISDDKSRSSMPVTMWYSKIIEGSALEPSYRNYVSVDKKVVKAGLAFWINNEVWRSYSLPTKEPVETETSDDKSDNKCSDNTIETNDSEDTVVATDICREIRATNIKEWPAASKLTSYVLNAYVTCAENEGYLFIREESLQPVYEKMEKIITQHLNTIPKDDYFTLREAQMVMVQSQGCWYRAVVIKVIDRTTAQIVMIDFGSDHIVKINELHNKIMYPEIPTLVNRIKLFDVTSKNKTWTNDEVDILINTTPEYAKIELRSSLHDTIPLAEVYDQNGVSLNDKLVELCPNLLRSQTKVQPDSSRPELKEEFAEIAEETDSPCREVSNSSLKENEEQEKIDEEQEKIDEEPCEEKEIIEEELCDPEIELKQEVSNKEKASDDTEEQLYEDAKEELNEEIVEQTSKIEVDTANKGDDSEKGVDWNEMVEQSGKHYTYNKMEQKMTEMDIIAVYDYKTISLYNPDDDSTEKEFEALTSAIRDGIADTECLEDIQVGMPCLSLYTEDNQWYRAKILKNDAQKCGYVTVIYVDYGNFEVAKLTDLRVIKPEWLAFPARFVEATIACNILQKDQENVLFKHAESLAGETKYIEVVNNDPLLVHVYNKVGDVFELHYDAFVKNEIVEI